MMEVKCCYCGEHMSWKKGPSGYVSHGVCDECLPQAWAEVNALISEKEKRNEQSDNTGHYVGS